MTLAAADVVGKTFGKLTVLRFAPPRKTGYGSRRQVVCECSTCGNEVTVLLQSLRSGNTKSCGCAKGVRNTAFSGGVPIKKDDFDLKAYLTLSDTEKLRRAQERIAAKERDRLTNLGVPQYSEDYTGVWDVDSQSFKPW
jgi:hypothetical protein